MNFYFTSGMYVHLSDETVKILDSGFLKKYVDRDCDMRNIMSLGIRHYNPVTFIYLIQLLSDQEVDCSVEEYSKIIELGTFLEVRNQAIILERYSEKINNRM